MIDTIRRINGTIYASVVTLNVPPWFDRKDRKTANVANGIVVLTVIQLTAILCGVVIVGSVSKAVQIGKTVLIIVFLSLFCLNYWWVVLQRGGEVHLQQFLGYTGRKRMVLRSFILLLYLVLVGVLFAFAPMKA